MRTMPTDHPGRRRLRFVFRNSTRSMDVDLDASLYDVAEALEGLAMDRCDRPVAIDLSFPVFDLSADVRPASLARLRKRRNEAATASRRNGVRRSTTRPNAMGG